MHKLKSVFRSSSRRRSQHKEESSPHTEATSPRSQKSARQTASLDEQYSRQSLDSHKPDAQRASRSRPVSSIYDSNSTGNSSGAKPLVANHAQGQPSQTGNDSIASDYKAYLPALSPVQDSNNDDYMSMGGDRRLISGESETRHEEDVADRNIDRYSLPSESFTKTVLPPIPGMCQDSSDMLQEALQALVSKNYINGWAVSKVPSQATTPNYPGRDPTAALNSGAGSVGTGKYSVGRDVVTKGGLVDSIRPHEETTAHEKNQWKNTSWPSRGARQEPRVAWSRRKSRSSEGDDDDFHSLPDGTDHDLHQSTSGPLGVSVPLDGQGDIRKEIHDLLDGVVDLSNTVDEDKDVKFAPAVTHEVIKPHEHEIVQHKIYREIHNYEYYHYLQPVYDLQVLPPRHWIPNPNGEGLIEISADELPSRTGDNRRWKIVREDLEHPAVSQRVWRTEPQIIEHPTTITAEGFERKETTIIHPPTLRDLSDYEGLVQPVHFDHKTGRRWLGEMTTMQRLKEQSSQARHEELSMKELGDTLPEVPSESDVPELSNSPSLKRKPVAGPVPARLGDLSGSKPVAAVA